MEFQTLKSGQNLMGNKTGFVRPGHIYYVILNIHLVKRNFVYVAGLNNIRKFATDLSEVVTPVKCHFRVSKK